MIYQHEQIEKLKTENAALRRALLRIAGWDLPRCTTPYCACGNNDHSYGWHWGSTGERDYMRGIAIQVLGVNWDAVTDDPAGT